MDRHHDRDNVLAILPRPSLTVRRLGKIELDRVIKSRDFYLSEGIINNVEPVLILSHIQCRITRRLRSFSLIVVDIESCDVEME